MARLALVGRAALQGALKLARLMALREDEAEALSRKLEDDPLFEGLLRAGALRRRPLPAAALAARRMAGLSLARPQTALGELIDGRSDLVALLKKAGRRGVEEAFLGTEPMTDRERARRCGLTEAEAARLRGFLDELYIRGEAEPAAAAPAKVYSTVAGLGMRGGKPELRFFNRPVWRSLYSLDGPALESFAAALPERQREAARRLARQVELLERRKATLLRALEALAQAQASYLRSGDPARRQALTQRALAAALKVDASVLNRLISNKAVELPWGTEAPLKVLLPSAKELARDLLAGLAAERPDEADEALRAELARRHRVYLSRRSVAQYRRELGLGGRGKRA